MQDTAITMAGPRRAGALAGLSLAILLSSLGTSIANVALPTLASVFAAPFQQVQWVVLAYLLASTVLIAGIGRLGDTPLWFAYGHYRNGILMAPATARRVAAQITSS